MHSRKHAALAAVATVMLSPFADTQAAGVRDAVVKVTASVRYPHPTKPWTKQEAAESMGTGVVIDGNRVLTCAHVVSYATRISLQGNEDPDRVSARLKAIDTTADLALLEVDDASFFEKHKPMKLGKGYPSPELVVETYGYPAGGENLAVTRGIISRIEANDPAEGIWIQVDAAVNPGSSGGPIVFFGQMVGLIRAQLDPSAAENVGMVVAIPQIEAFLSDAEDGKITRRATAGFHFQSLKSAAARERLGLDKKVTGVVVTCLDVNGPQGLLQNDDVLTKIGDFEIDNEGMVKIDRSLRAPLTAVVTQQPGSKESLPLQIIRQGNAMTIDLPLKRDVGLFSAYDGTTYPSYFVYGPLVFSKSYYETNGFIFRNRPELFTLHSPLRERLWDSAAPGEELVIVCSPLLPHEMSRGIDPPEPFGRVVADVDGIRIKNLAHLVETLRDGTSPFVCIRTAEHPPLQLVYRRDEIRAATERILDENDISKVCSADLAPIWTKPRE